MTVKVKEGKYYGMANGKKVGPMKYSGFLASNNYPFYCDDHFGWWSESGKRLNINLPETNIISEWKDEEITMTRTYGAPRELNLEPGDVIGWRGYSTNSIYWTMQEDGITLKSKSGANLDKGIDYDGAKFFVVSRAIKPLPELNVEEGDVVRFEKGAEKETEKEPRVKWRDMTPEEKGALLLAHHEKKAIENDLSFPVSGWVTSHPCWVEDVAYRIKKDLVIKVESENVRIINKDGIQIGSGTVTAFNGKPDLNTLEVD